MISDAILTITVAVPGPMSAEALWITSFPSAVKLCMGGTRGATAAISAAAQPVADHPPILHHRFRLLLALIPAEGLRPGYNIRPGTCCSRAGFSGERVSAEFFSGTLSGPYLRHGPGRSLPTGVPLFHPDRAGYAQVGDGLTINFPASTLGHSYVIWWYRLCLRQIAGRWPFRR